MPFIQVTIERGRPPELKEQLIVELTESAVHVLGAPKESVRVLIQEIEPAHWGIAGESISKRREGSR
ncbi:4-oxalocrotonate tautomerase family protein [Bacillus sp. OxB-1]|uniref:tautomerase family protein n=1 Tax=Bacillus sp. (strain OxB-1) TaxID=98228 RepID=UPI000581D782|nr:4-oxalocrotonate tautomerase family protein [Bacillus sp. OxB-1]BAQ10977.1 4-oxalocrotonate tautomerase family protein [Bacillus sp. OxB-1]